MGIRWIDISCERVEAEKDERNFYLYIISRFYFRFSTRQSQCVYDLLVLSTIYE
jgi:hypothetical protein